MTEDQEIEKTNTSEKDDVEGHSHHRGRGNVPYGAGAQDEELNTEDDDVEGHFHHRGRGN